MPARFIAHSSIRDVDIRVLGRVHGGRGADDRADETAAGGKAVVGRVAAGLVADDEVAILAHADAEIVVGEVVALDAVAVSEGEDVKEEPGADAVPVAGVVDEMS
jgi:hypothetical protein